MSEKPILFSGPMVRAILSGAKSQTRRVIKQQPSGRENFPPSAFSHPDHWYFRDGYYACPENDIGNYVKCPYGSPGSVLWVRETWAQGEYREYAPGGASMATGELYMLYRATNPNAEPDGGWKPSIFMPRWASRLLLRVTDVRVQRLQEISEEDARAEGMTGGCFPGMVKSSTLVTAVQEFARLWDSLNGKKPGCSWSDNPWVWCVSFERIESEAIK